VVDWWIGGFFRGDDTTGSRTEAALIPAWQVAGSVVKVWREI